MLINNFPIIEQFMKFQEGSYYKFEALIRNTDGENPLFYEGMSKTNKNILIKNWFIDTEDYYKKAKEEMKRLCDITRARLYITLDRKSVKKTLVELHKEISNRLYNYTYGDTDCLTIKKLAKQFASKTSVIESSDKDSKTLMFDVDTKNEWIFKSLKDMLEYYKFPYWVLNTKKGYHIVIERRISTDKWMNALSRHLLANSKDFPEKAEFSQYNPITDYVSLKPNELGLVYMNIEEQ